MPEIQIGENTIPYTIRKSKRAKNLIIKIGVDHGVEVVIPHRARIDSVEPFLRRREDWLLQNHLYYQAQRDHQDGRQFITGETLPFMDQILMLDVEQKTRGKRTSVELDEDTLRLIVRLRSDIEDAEHREETTSAIEKWYREQAKAILVPLTRQIAEQYGFSPKNIAIRGQKTRWGSCSSNGNLNLNWRLLLAPSEAMKYVIIHELCHLRELNHSKRFWQLVGEYCPDYRKWRKWLKDNDTTLRL